MNIKIPLVMILLIGCNTLAVKAQETPKGVDPWNMSFGLGVEQFKDTYIDEASLRGETRIVVIDKSTDTLPSAWLTLNWNFFGFDTDKEVIKGNDVYDTKYGLFAGVKIVDGNGSSFNAFSFGPQVTFVTADRDISIGIGWVTHQTRTLANGIVAGSVLPDFYDDVQFETGTENSYMLMMSVSF